MLGGAGALALMGNGNAALVGVGIAVALLPPLVNSGLLFGTPTCVVLLLLLDADFTVVGLLQQMFLT